jgi:hypothetical protein
MGPEEFTDPKPSPGPAAEDGEHGGTDVVADTLAMRMRTKGLTAVVAVVAMFGLWGSPASSGIGGAPLRGRDVSGIRLPRQLMVIHGTGERGTFLGRTGPFGAELPARRRPGTAARLVPGTACTLFPSDNIWNTDISKAPVNAMSPTWLSSMAASTTDLHPDFGRPPYGLPFAIVGDSHPTVSIRFQYADESDPGPYPFGPDIPLEQGSDRHALMVNRDTCTLFELYEAYWNNGSPVAGSGAIWNLASNALRPDGWTSADAAGLPILPGLVRVDEVRAGFIGHAIRFTAQCTTQAHLWPARHDAGQPNPSCPPMGARFRLKASFDISGFSPAVQVVLRAMQHYGMFLADNGSNWYFQGTEDRRWTDSFLDQLKQVPASAFEAIDESSLMIDPDSGQSKPCC